MTKKKDAAAGAAKESEEGDGGAAAKVEHKVCRNLNTGSALSPQNCIN